MPATPAAVHTQKAGAISTAATTQGGAAQSTEENENKVVRLHITPFTPALLKVYLAPSIQPLAKNISYHTVETFPEKVFGYVELPEMEAQKLKNKLNGSTLKGSKVRIEKAKPEKRKAGEDADAEQEIEERSAKRSKKKAKNEQGVLDGAVLPDDRKVKRGWTEPPTKSKKDKREKKGKEDKDQKTRRKESKYTKEPEVLFKAKLTPVAATEVASKEKSKDKKQDKKKSSKREAIVHEFENNTKTPSFLKASAVSTEKKEAVEYVNGKGWVDEDGNVVEPETGKVRNRRVLELVDAAPVLATTEKQQSITPSPKSSPGPKSAKTKKTKARKVTPPPSSSESEGESSVVSSSSDDDSSDSEEEIEAAVEVPVSSPPPAPKADTPEISLTPSSPPEQKEVHPLEALYKRAKPTPLLNLSVDSTSAPVSGLAPINTSFSFFDNNSDTMDVDVDVDASANPPATPFTQRDLEWRGLRSAAPTPDTAAIGRRFSFPWRKSSHEADDAEAAGDDVEAEKQLSNNTKANASKNLLPGVAEETEEEDEAEEDEEAGAKQLAAEKDDAEEEEEKPESEFKTWFWENQGGLNRAWKKRRRDALKAKRLSDNKKAVGGGRRAV